MTGLVSLCWVESWVHWRRRWIRGKREWCSSFGSLTSAGVMRQRQRPWQPGNNLQRRRRAPGWFLQMSGSWSDKDEQTTRSLFHGEKQWVASRVRGDQPSARRLWRQVWQRPWRTLFQDEYFAWSTTGLRHPPTSTAILGLFFFAFVALVIPIFLVFLAVASQLFVLTIVLSVPLLLLGAVSLFGVGGLLCVGGVAIATVATAPVLALSSASQGLLLPALGVASIGSCWWLYRQRQARAARIAEMSSEASTSGSTEATADEAYLERAREDLAQFDARLFGSTSSDAAARMREPSKSPFSFGWMNDPPVNIWGVRREEVERWNERQVARAAQSFGLPLRVCKWLARELVDGRVVLALTDAEQQELISTVQPRLTFGERKLLRDFLRYLSRAV